MKRLAAGIHIAFCCSVALAWPLESSLALDLTPHAGVLQGNEGPATPILEFTNGSKKITWVAPHDWIADGGGKSLSLSAPGGSTAWMKLIVAPIVKEDPQQPVTDPAAKPEDIEAWPRKYLPGGAQDVSFVKMVPSPFTVCTHPATEYIFTYARYGSKATISISAVDFSDTERLVVIYSSNATEFEKTRQTVIGSMFTWQYK